MYDMYSYSLYFFFVIVEMVALKIICIIKEYCILIISFTFCTFRVFTCNSITWHPIVNLVKVVYYYGEKVPSIQKLT